MSQAVTSSKVALLAFPPERIQQTIEGSFQQPTRSRMYFPLRVRSLPFLFVCSSKTSKSRNDVRKLVSEKVPGQNDDEQNTYLAVYSSFAHLGPFS